MDDLQEAKRFLKIVAKSQAKAERQRAKDRADNKRQWAENKRQRAKERADNKRQRAEDKRQHAELRERFKRTDILIGHLNNRFGDIAEAMLVGDVAETLETIDNLQLEHSFYSAKTINGNAVVCEIDALLVGQDSVVVMEAKSKLTTSKVKRFVKNRLNRFTKLFPDFANKKVYGAVGYLKAEDEAVKSAIKEGLLVVRSSLQSKEIINPKNFKPKNYNPRH